MEPALRFTEDLRGAFSRACSAGMRLGTLVTVPNGTEIRVISDKNLVLDFDLDLDVVLDLDSRGPTANGAAAYLILAPFVTVANRVPAAIAFAALGPRTGTARIKRISAK